MRGGVNNLPLDVFPAGEFPLIGAWHDSAVAFVKAEWNPSAGYATWSHPAVDSIVGFMVDYVNDSLSSQLGTTTISSALIDSLATLASIPSALRTNYLSGVWNSLSAGPHFGIDSLEVNLVDTAISYLVSIQSMSAPAVYDSMINEANHLLLTFNSYTWTDTSGDLAAGTLYIFLSTAQYHLAYGRAHQKGDDPLNIEEAAAADIIGFAIGYWGEHGVEQATGQPINQSKCNNAGLIEAGAESAFALLIPL
jgi:hypothetical protein